MISNFRCIMPLVVIIALSLFITSCPSPYVIKDPWSLPPDAHDMDKVVNMKGAPLSVNEQTIYLRGREIRNISLFYSGDLLQFKSNADRSLTRLESSSSGQFPIPQSPLPAWFKVKYPHLNYSNIPTAR